MASTVGTQSGLSVNLPAAVEAAEAIGARAREELSTIPDSAKPPDSPIHNDQSGPYSEKERARSTIALDRAQAFFRKEPFTVGMPPSREIVTEAEPAYAYLLRAGAPPRYALKFLLLVLDCLRRKAKGDRGLIVVCAADAVSPPLITDSRSAAETYESQVAARGSVPIDCNIDEMIERSMNRPGTPPMMPELFALMNAVQLMEAAVWFLNARYAEKKVFKVTRLPTRNLGVGKATQWFKKNARQYSGEWVAIENGNLLAHDPDQMKLYDRLKSEGKLTDDVFMAFVEP